MSGAYAQYFYDVVATYIQKNTSLQEKNGTLWSNMNYKISFIVDVYFWLFAKMVYLFIIKKYLKKFMLR